MTAMSRAGIYLIAGVSAAVVRLVLNFSQELIPGVNGGYYPLQVRSLLSNGHLAFADMPLLFYLDAALVRILTLSGLPASDALILALVKGVDSLSLPLLLLPLYRTVRHVHTSMPVSLEAALAFFAVVSFCPLTLIGDLQKNALAVVFVFAALYFLSKLPDNPGWRIPCLIVSFCLLTALTHFGSFALLMSILLLATVFRFGRSAWIPILLSFTAGLAIVAFFDPSRAARLSCFWTAVVERPMILNGPIPPQDILNILLSWVLAGFGILILRNRPNIGQGVRSLWLSQIASLVVLSLPVYDAEYSRRFSLFLFIPQVFLLVLVSGTLRSYQARIWKFVFLVMIVISSMGAVANRKAPVMDEQAQWDLSRLERILPEHRDKTMIVARHGLEWWTAWFLKTRVAQDKAIDGEVFRDYQTVIILRQNKGNPDRSPGTPFHEPAIPPEASRAWSSEYFDAFIWAR